MAKKQTPARAFLKELQFSLDKKPHQMTRLLLKSLSAEYRARLEYIWAMRSEELATGLGRVLINPVV